MEKFSQLFMYFLLSSIVFGLYQEGDQISLEHQNMEFNYCYPEDIIGNTLRLANYNGDLNGGDYKVIVLDMAASW